MSRRMFAPALIAAAALAGGAIAIAQQSGDSKPGGQPEVKLPPGWTEADMQACMLAGTPGKMHERLARGAGAWLGKTTTWMFPGSEPTTSECTYTVTPIMDGRYTRIEMAGDMPGMGPYSGLGVNGFDNVSEKFVSTWIDNHSTGILTGTGKLSPDGKVLSWSYTYNCPITRKPTILSEVETITGPDTMTLEISGADPKSGKEFQMMKIELRKKK